MCLQIPSVWYVPVDIQVHVLTRLNWSLLMPLQWLPFITMDLAIRRMQWAPTAAGLTAKLLVLCWVKPILNFKFWSLLSHFNVYFKGQYNYYYTSFSFILWCKLLKTVTDIYCCGFIYVCIFYFAWRKGGQSCTLKYMHMLEFSQTENVFVFLFFQIMIQISFLRETIVLGKFNYRKKSNYGSALINAYWNLSLNLLKTATVWCHK